MKHSTDLKALVGTTVFAVLVMALVGLGAAYAVRSGAVSSSGSSVIESAQSGVVPTSCSDIHMNQGLPQPSRPARQPSCDAAPPAEILKSPPSRDALDQLP